MSDLEKLHLLQEIEMALDDIRPHLAVDGGGVTVVEVTEGMTVKVRWMGACETCSMSAMTMRAGVEQTVKSRLPQIHSVVAINNLHA